MIAEKLLLHLLIILVPILMYGFFQDKIREGHSPYLLGILLGLASFLCISFPTYRYGFYWDLRYIPLVISFLYAGRKAGGIVIIFILTIRTYIGGETVVYGYINCVICAFILLLVSKNFLFLEPKKRLWRAILISFLPIVITLGLWVLYIRPQDIFFESNKTPLLEIALFIIIQFIGSVIAIMLNEAIIERRSMKEKIIRAEKLNTLGELAASIAHEVRNPLTVVKGFLQFMQHKGDNNLSYIPIILDELNRAEAIISDYLSFAKPQLKKIEQFDLSEFISSVLVLLTPLATKQGVILDSQTELNITLATDKNYLQQVIVNLVKNAIEATSEGGYVYIRLQNKNGQAQIDIKDTGRGMSKEQLLRLGTLFYSTKEKGTGVGTLVSLRMIEMMGGRISFKSKENVGTEVLITLPSLHS